SEEPGLSRPRQLGRGRPGDEGSPPTLRAGTRRSRSRSPLKVHNRLSRIPAGDGGVKERLASAGGGGVRGGGGQGKGIRARRAKKGPTRRQPPGRPMDKEGYNGYTGDCRWVDPIPGVTMTPGPGDSPCEVEWEVWLARRQPFRALVVLAVILVAAAGALLL